MDRGGDCALCDVAIETFDCPTKRCTTLTIRLMIVDSHRITRDGVRALLARLPGIEVVAEAEDGRSAVELAHEQRPAVVVTEIALPVLNGIEVTRQIASALPDVRVLALSQHQERRFVIAAFAAGAAGYLPKTCGFDELIRAIDEVYRGHHYISPAIARTIVDEVLRHAVFSEPIGDPSLTPREREVLQLLAEGHSTKEIAVLLQVSPKTVETHRRQIMTKLDLHSIADLTRYALHEGISPF